MNRDYLYGLILPHGFNIANALEEMKRGGTSVLLNWSEGDPQGGLAEPGDGDMWECSWITGGKRYTALESHVESAVRECVRKVLEVA